MENTPLFEAAFKVDSIQAMWIVYQLWEGMIGEEESERMLQKIASSVDDKLAPY